MGGPPDCRSLWSVFGALGTVPRLDRQPEEKGGYHARMGECRQKISQL
jgi:hypothetical protein